MLLHMTLLSSNHQIMSDLISELEKVKWNNIPDSFVVFDVETTGLDARSDRVLEIGAVLYEKEFYISTGEVKTFQCFVKQTKPIPPEATAINKITDEMVRDGEEEYKALEMFFDFVGSNDLYAYNAKFDKTFMNAMARRSRYSHEPVVDKVFDILKFIRDEWEIKPNYKLTTVAKYLKIDVKDAHRAVGDSALALKSYIHIVQMINMTQRKHELDHADWIRKNITSYGSKSQDVDKLEKIKDESKNLEKEDSTKAIVAMVILGFLFVSLFFVSK